jgi:hypothetical protein
VLIAGAKKWQGNFAAGAFEKRATFMSSKLDRLLASADAIVLANSGLRVNGKVASDRTQEYSRQLMSETCRRLHKLGFYLEDISGLSAKHIDALVKDWHVSKHKNKTMQNQYSRLKIFCGWAGKGGIVHPLGFAGHLPEIPNEDLRVKTYTEKSVSWSGQGIDVGQKVDEALLQDVRHGNMLRMNLAFGLRKKEDLKIKLWRADKGHALEIEGAVAKNGKFRSIPIDTATDYGRWQRWVLDEAKKLCGKYAPLGWPGRTFKQNENRYHYLNRKLGITKLELGVVGHGLRAEFFENQAMLRGMLPVSLGGSRVQMEKKELDRINLEVSQLGGHDDAHTIGAYYGSLRRLPKADGRGERAGGVAVDGTPELIAGIYVNPPVILAGDGSFRKKTPIEREQTEVTIVTEQIGLPSESVTLSQFLTAYPGMTQKIENLLVLIGL